MAIAMAPDTADRRRRAAGRPPPRLRTVLLDCLGTLLRLEPPAPHLRVELSKRGIAVSEERAAAGFRAEIAYYLEHHLEGSAAAGLDRLRDACARVLSGSLGIGPDRLPAVRDAMLAALRFSPYPDAEPALRALRAAGLRLVVASNWDCSLERALTATGLRPLVDGVVTSAEAGAAKPDPAVLTAALEMAGGDAARAVCVGDSVEEDLGAARKAGVGAILLARAGDVPSREGPVVRSLDEAVSLILAGA